MHLSSKHSTDVFVCNAQIDLFGEIAGTSFSPDGDRFFLAIADLAYSSLVEYQLADRLRQPMIREGSTWREAGWDEALDLVARRLKEIRAQYGKHAIAVYQGNPTAHNLGLMTYAQLALRTLGTRNMYSATSLDQLPHMLAALQMFGNQLLMAVPDVDRCDLFICLGANPLASNGSIMTAPDIRGRLKAIQARGGKVIVLDPRRTETADKADRHLFIRPGGDAEARAPRFRSEGMEGDGAAIRSDLEDRSASVSSRKGSSIEISAGITDQTAGWLLGSGNEALDGFEGGRRHDLGDDNGQAAEAQ